jgi:hypothetical protein
MVEKPPTTTFVAEAARKGSAGARGMGPLAAPSGKSYQR